MTVRDERGDRLVALVRAAQLEPVLLDHRQAEAVAAVGTMAAEPRTAVSTSDGPESTDAAAMAAHLARHGADSAGRSPAGSNAVFTQLGARPKPADQAAHDGRGHRGPP